jgi:hypothetical protein
MRYLWTHHHINSFIFHSNQQPSLPTLLPTKPTKHFKSIIMRSTIIIASLFAAFAAAAPAVDIEARQTVNIVRHFPPTLHCTLY